MKLNSEEAKRKIRTHSHLPHVRYVLGRPALVGEHYLRDQGTGQDDAARCSHTVEDIVLRKFRHVWCAAPTTGTSSEEGGRWLPAVSRLLSFFRRIQQVMPERQ